MVVVVSEVEGSVASFTSRTDWEKGQDGVTGMAWMDASGDDAEIRKSTRRPLGSPREETQKQKSKQKQL